jgi:hypothetical protein
MPSKKQTVVPADQFVKQFSPVLQDLVRRLQQLIRTAYPGVAERAYPGWSSLRYFTSERFSDRVVYLSPGRDYVNLGFERSRTLPDPRNLLTGKGANMRHIRISIATKFEDDYYVSLLKVAFQQSLAGKAEAQVSLKGKSAGKEVASTG